MKKWTFWITMCAISVLNGTFFFTASLHSMRRGIEGADNQAALLFIPMLWIAAVLVLIALNGYTLFRGRRIEKERLIHVSGIFRLSELPKSALAGRISFFVAACLLMLFGFSLFWSEIILAAAYAVSGGVLLLFLYVWEMEGLRKTA